MMSRGVDAVAAHDAVLKISSATAHDKSVAYVNKADAQNMMGLLSDALQSIRKALQIDPSNLDAYYQYVQICKESKCRVDQNDWLVFANEIAASLKKRTKPTKNNDDNDSYYYEEGEGEDNGQETVKDIPISVYWALYEAYQKAGGSIFIYTEIYNTNQITTKHTPLLLLLLLLLLEGNIDKAWDSLNTAHQLEIDRRRQDGRQRGPRTNYEQVAQVFKAGFWPSGVGSKSKVPIFIVGMMRCVFVIHS